MTARHQQLTASSRAGADKAAEHLDALTRAYGRALRAAGRRAAGRFRQTETLTAAADPKWVPPPAGSLIDQAELAADTERKTAKIHRLMLKATATTALEPFGISFDLRAPTSRALLDSIAARIQATITSAIAEQITEAVQTGYTNGDSVVRVSNAIQTATDAISRPRADMLARTDLNAISNGGSLLAASASGAAPYKQWLATEDERTRETHSEADGQVVEIDQSFQVGGENGMYPGDPQLDWEETANCRCTLVYVDSLTASAEPRVATPRDFAAWREGAWDGYYEDGAWVQQLQAATVAPGKLYLARHALTSYDSDDHATDEIRGWADDPLNDAGRLEAAALAGGVADLGLEIVWTSDLERGSATGDAIVDRLQIAALPMEDLRPWNLGDFAGRTAQDAADEIAGYVDAPLSCVPGGESFTDFCSRFLPVLADAMRQVENGATILMVTHSHNLKLARAWIQNGRQPVVGSEFMEAAPGTASVLAVDPADSWSVVEIMCDGAAIEPTGMVPPAAHYRPATDADRECGTCDFFSAGLCTMFDADVLTDYICDEFVARSSTSAVTSGGTMGDTMEVTTAAAERFTAIRDRLAALGAGGVFDDDELRAILLTVEALAAEPLTASLGDFQLTAAADGGTQWQATLCVAGQPTVDSGMKRLLTEDGGSWLPLPLPLGLLDDTPHADVATKSPICGRIDQIWMAGNVCQASGIFFDASSDPDVQAAGSKAAALVGEMRRMGVSVDLVDTEVELMVWNGSSVTGLDEPEAVYPVETVEAVTPGDGLDDNVEIIEDSDEDEYIMAFTRWVIGGATVCPVQALTQATISLVADALTAAAAGLTPLEPPAAWFDDPQLDGPTPLTVTDDGQVYGHLALWGTCHTGKPGMCVTPPRSPSGYRNFHRGELKTADGGRIDVGVLTMNTGHATLRMNAAATVAHYDDTGLQGAHVRAGEDTYGIWLAGALNPKLPAEDARVLMASPPSGDWREVNRGEGLDLFAALAVNVQGFPVPRPSVRLVASGVEMERVALVAAGIVSGSAVSETDFARQLAVLAASADGIDGLAALAAA